MKRTSLGFALLLHLVSSAIFGTTTVVCTHVTPAGQIASGTHTANISLAGGNAISDIAEEQKIALALAVGAANGVCVTLFGAACIVNRAQIMAKCRSNTSN